MKVTARSIPLILLSISLAIPPHSLAVASAATGESAELAKVHAALMGAESARPTSISSPLTLTPNPSDRQRSEVPSEDFAEGIRIGPIAGERLRVTLPGVKSGNRRAEMANGATVFLNPSADTTVIKSGVGTQTLSTIRTKNAPSRYRYTVEGGRATSVVIVASGGAEVHDSHGTVVATIPPPWAVDSRGHAVPTHYESNGASLVQVVDHASHPGVSYPVVADPFFLIPAVVRCLAGIGLNGPQIAKIAQAGTAWAIVAAGGYAALRCVMGR